MAGSSRGIRAGKAFVEFHADKSPFVRAVKSMSADLKQWGATVASIGAKVAATSSAAMATLTAAATSFAASGNEMAKLSQRTGASAEALSALKYAAEQSGTSIGTIGGVMSKVRSDIADVAKGNFDLAMSYSKIGVSVNQLARLKPEEQFALLLDRVSRIRDPIMQAAAANEIFGGSAEELLPMIQRGSAGLVEAANRAKELGLVMSGKSAASAENFAGVIHDVQSAAMGLWRQIGAALAPTLTELGSIVADYVGKASRWVSQNHELIVALGKGAALVAGFGAALVAIGGTVTAVGIGFGAIATAVTAAGAVLSAILSPIGLVVTGLAAGTAAFFTMTDAGRSSATQIGEALGKLYDQFGGYWQGITDAVGSGNLALAGEIALTALQLEFHKAMEYLHQQWRDFTIEFVDLWDFATSELAAGMTDANSYIEGGFATSISWIQTQWERAIMNIKRLWADMAKWIGEVMKPITAGMEAFHKAIGTDSLLESTGIKLPSIDDQVAAYERSASDAERDFSANLVKRSLQDAKDALPRELDRQATSGIIRDDYFARSRDRQESDGTATDGQKRIAELRAELAANMAEAKANMEALRVSREERIKGVAQPGGTAKPGVSSSGFDFGAAKQSIAGSFSAAAAARISGTGDPQLRELQSISRGINSLVNQQLKFT